MGRQNKQRVERVIIMGAAGRDFHDFNVYWKGRANTRVVCFTATQIPNIDGRTYPAELAGKDYPDGIMIYPEDDLEKLIAEHEVDRVAFAYSDIAYEDVMHKAARVNAAGAEFCLLGANQTMLKSTKPVVAVCAVRTGCGKSQTTRKVASILRDLGKKVAVIRHPMPYGDLAAQRCQRYGVIEDMDKHLCTIEEREEYEKHIEAGNLLFAGVDYGEILKQAEAEADVILWDGGNNDYSFYQADLYITVCDPHRAGHEAKYYPGEANLRLADMVIINKMDTADAADVHIIENNIANMNPKATVLLAASPVTVDKPDLIRGKRVLVVEDGPTVTHGGMTFGAGVVAARQLGATEIVDPRPYAVGSIKETFAKYNHLTNILPAMGYGDKQVAELEETIRKVPCDAVLVGTPIDLRRVVKIDQPAVRVTYVLDEEDKTILPNAIEKLVAGQLQTV